MQNFDIKIPAFVKWILLLAIIFFGFRACEHWLCLLKPYVLILYFGTLIVYLIYRTIDNLKNKNKQVVSYQAITRFFYEPLLIIILNQFIHNFRNGLESSGGSLSPLFIIIFIPAFWLILSAYTFGILIFISGKKEWFNFLMVLISGTICFMSWAWSDKWSNSYFPLALLGLAILLYIQNKKNLR